MNKYLLSLLLLTCFGLTACGGSDSSSVQQEVPVDNEENGDSGSDDSGSDDDGADEEGDVGGEDQQGTIEGPFSTGSTSAPQAVYYDLDTATALTLTEKEAQTNTEWDIGFERTSVFVNTHQETPVSVYFTGNNSDFYDDDGAPIADKFLNATPDSELDDYLSVTANDIPESEAFSTDTDSEVIGDTFYTYDMSTHEVSPASEVFYIVSSDENFTRFHVTDIVTEGRGIGTITLGVMHQSAVDGQMEFADEIELTLEAVGCASPVYIDFDLKQQVTEADNWDLSIPCANGAGEFALNLANDAKVLRTDGETYTGIDPAAAGYLGFSENAITEYAFEQSPWYYYDSTSHLLYSQFGVYLIKRGDSTFKLQITSYYDDEGTSGNYSFRADLLGGE